MVKKHVSGDGKEPRDEVRFAWNDDTAIFLERAQQNNWTHTIWTREGDTWTSQAFKGDPETLTPEEEDLLYGSFQPNMPRVINRHKRPYPRTPIK